MRRIPGKGRLLLWLLWLLWPLLLQAAPDYVWNASQSKRLVARHEAFVAEYRCRFAGEGYEYVIVLKPPKETDAYRLVIESERERIVDGQRINTYRFIVFPKKAGRLVLDLNASMEHTTKESIENTVIGRDNVEDFDFVATTVRLPEIAVEVQPQPERFAGVLSLNASTDKKVTDAFSPVQFRVRLEGYGNLDRFGDFNFSVAGAKIFTDGVRRTLRLDDEGYRGTIEQQFAVVADRNFTIPSLTLRYYDTKARKVRTLRTEAVPITVRGYASPSSLLDAPEAAEKENGGIGWGWLNLLLAFVAGIAVGRFLLPVSEEEEASAPLPTRLKRCRDPKKFAAYLAMYDGERYEAMIEEIEMKLKRGGKVDLKYYRKLLRL